MSQWVKGKHCEARVPYARALLSVNADGTKNWGPWLMERCKQRRHKGTPCCRAHMGHLDRVSPQTSDA